MSYLLFQLQVFLNQVQAQGIKNLCKVGTPEVKISWGSWNDSDQRFSANQVVQSGQSSLKY